ncbi:hypothetical protein CCAX7_23000 [Capsulimonas corticalis]|uniref:Uncharacterized protein n=1 Tax=Capsulimonas corticalis TaxID=2219043 RepID=A0A402CV17_9BACT|nr:beta-propeller fold lactonase family protein [Capsulimonas corticalis]BDI30249.1 hypothetical protein CCAX7_23000 [Capsulimonas corticalis]
MTKRIPLPAVALTLAASAVLPSALHAETTLAPQPRIADASGAVYTANNSVNRNEVFVYHRDASGALTFLGEYPTGGRGSGGIIDPLQSQNSLLLSENHRFLFAVNSGSGDVSTFAVGSEGRLSLLGRAASGGGFPVALAVHGELLYVLNSGGAGSVSGFHIQSSGHLQPIVGSTQFLSGASAGGASIDFSPDGTVLAATERLTNRIDTFPISAGGAAGPALLNNSAGRTPFSLTFTPQGALVVAEAAGNPAGGAALSSYAVQSNDLLSVLTPSAPTGFAAACWVVATADGNYAYAANAGSSQISIAAIGDNGALTILGSAGTGPGSTPLDLALSSNNRYLYALTAGAGTISAFRVQGNGGLAALAATPSLPAASGQNGLAAY